MLSDSFSPLPFVLLRSIEAVGGLCKRKAHTSDMIPSWIERGFCNGKKYDFGYHKIKFPKIGKDMTDRFSFIILYTLEHSTQIVLSTC